MCKDPMERDQVSGHKHRHKVGELTRITCDERGEIYIYMCYKTKEVYNLVLYNRHI